MISSASNGRWIGKLDRFRQMANVPMAQRTTHTEPIITLPNVNNRIDHRPASSSPKQARQQSKMKRQGRASLATSSESSVTTISRQGSASNGSGAASKGSSASSILIDAAHRAKRSRLGTPFPIGAIQSASSSESDATDYSDDDIDEDERARRRDSIIDFDVRSSSPLQSSLHIAFEPIVVDEDEDTMEIPETVPMPVHIMQRANAPAVVLTSAAHMRIQASAPTETSVAANNATVAVPNNACSCSTASGNQIMEVLETLNRQLAAANAKTARVNAMVEDAVKHLFMLREEQVANEAECAQLRAAITIMHKQFNVV